MRRSLRVLGAVALLTAAGNALADPCEAPLPSPGTVFEGRVDYVGDGDGLCVLSPNGLVEVRLQDWSAPELSQPSGRAAKTVLSSIVRGRRIRCVAGQRSFDRVVAACTLDGVGLGDLMRRAGQNEGGR